MNPRLPVVLLTAFALAAPGAVAFGKEKDKNKNKDKNKTEQTSDDRSGGDRDHHDNDGDGKVTICHIPPGNRSARHTITVGESAWSAHKGHGDTRGACGHNNPNPPPGGRTFEALDVNNDGRLSLREFGGDRTVFDRLDRDRDGYLSPREFANR